MEANKNATPEFYDEDPFDPVSTAIGSNRILNKQKKKTVDKKKAGFYLSNQILDRFNRKFHELKLDGVNIENKSVLVEAAIKFTLDDIDKGDDSIVLNMLAGRKN